MSVPACSVDHIWPFAALLGVGLVRYVSCTVFTLGQCVAAPVAGVVSAILAVVHKWVQVFDGAVRVETCCLTLTLTPPC